MHKRIISLFLILVIMFSSFIEPVLATEPEIFTSELTESMEIATDSNAIEPEKSEEIIEDNILNNESFDDSILEEEPADKTLENIDISTDSNAIKDEEENIEPEIETEFEKNNISINENILAMIPESSEDLLDDFGMSEGFIADISKISTFSLRNPNNVTLKTPQYEDGTELSVIHFIESVYHISDDAIILNVSEYSNSSKTLLEPAIAAYQEYFETSDECVAIEIFNVTVEDKTISFEPESFSIFAVGQAFLNTFEFYVDDELVNTQYIIGNSSGEGLLLEPEIPVKDHYIFNGWKISGTDDYQKFGTIKVNMSEHTTIRFDADFEAVCYAYFLYEAREGAYVLETITGKPGETALTKNIDYPLNLDKHVISWHTDVTLQSEPVESITFVQGEDIILYPNIAIGAWITFYTGGGSYMEPIFYQSIEQIETPEIPTKTGYIFSHWIDEEGNTFEFNNQLLNSSVSLTAVWTPANTNYYVQIMFERQNENGKYDAATGGLFTKQGPTGATVNGNMSTEAERNNAINKIDDESAFIMDFAHYEYNAEKSANSTTTVLGDGSSIVYVYYDLKYYTVTFNLGTTTGKKLTIGGKTYVSGSNVEQYKITEKYGSLIADQWPLAEHFESDDNFRRWQYKSGYYWATKQHYMIGSDLINKTMTANYSSSSTIIAWYLVESLDQTSPEGGSFEGKDFRKLYEGVYYDMDPVYTQEVKSTVSQWSTQKPIAGYNIVKMVKDSGANCVYMYYSRTRHNINLYNNGNRVAFAEDVMFGTPLTSIPQIAEYVNGKTPAYPNQHPEGTYEFVGWYNTLQCYDGTDVDLKTMTIPNQDTDLYSKWQPINVKLYVHVTIDGTDNIIEGFNGFTVLYGDKVDKDRVDELKASVNIPEDAIWYGWYEKISIGDNSTVLVPYNFNRELITDLILYPFYSYIEPTQVIYDINGGSGSAPVDEYRYAVGKGAVILDGDNIIPPENKLFLGWNTSADGSGTTYYPNDVMVLDKNEPVLYALYGNIPDENPEVNITYHNTISGESVSETYKIYESIIIKDISVFSESISKKYVFKEYNTSSDGTGDSFNPGDEVYLNTEGENILYAIYETIDVLLLEIPISKEFIKFSKTDEIFKIVGAFCNEEGIEISDSPENISFKYKGNTFENITLEITLDTSKIVEGNIYHVKVYEESKQNLIVYDTNYYVVSFELENFTPTITNVRKYTQNGNEIESFEFDGSLEFVNIMMIEADSLPDMGGNGTLDFRFFGSVFIFVGLFVLMIFTKKNKKK